MVKQGDIIRINFSPQSGHEQAGERPAVVLSNDMYIELTQKAVVCPITSTDKDFPLQVRLDNRTKTQGVVMCEQLKSLDIESRGYGFIEPMPSDLLELCVEIGIAIIDTP
jgi:mRNA interferase MazF